MPRKRNQQAERQGAIYTDQHGRPWETTFDLQALATCQAPMPWRWTAPVLPPPAYFQEFKNRPLVFEINYSKWISDLEEREKEFRQATVELARKMDKDPDAQLVREIMGKRPFPADMPRACRAGNRWALGFVKDWATRCPPWAEAYREFWQPEVKRVEEFADVAEGEFSEPSEPLPDEKYGQFEDVHDPQGVGGQRQKTVKMKQSATAA